MKGASWMDIRSDRQKGMSYVELGKKYHMDPRDGKAVRGVATEGGVHAE